MIALTNFGEELDSLRVRPGPAAFDGLDPECVDPLGARRSLESNGNIVILPSRACHPTVGRSAVQEMALLVASDWIASLVTDRVGVSRANPSPFANKQ